jgi:hypothetical protein
MALFVKGAGLALAAIGAVVAFIGIFWVWGVAAQDGELLWCLFVPFYVILYTVRNLDRAGRPMALYLIGFLFIGVGAVLNDFPVHPINWASAPPGPFNPGNPVNPPPGPFNPQPPGPAPGPFVPQEGRPPWVKRDPATPTDFKGLLAWWNFDEGKGNRAADASGNGQDATLHGGKWIKGIKGNALWLNGTTDYADYSDSPKLNFPARGAFTIAGWIQTNARDGTVLSQRNSRDGSPDIDVILAAGGLHIDVRHDGNEFANHASLSSGAVNDGDWHHFALTRNGNGIVELFADGVTCGQAANDGAGGAITTDLRAIGSERYWLTHGGGATYFSGCVDEFCIYNRALTSQQIKSLAGR